MLRTDANMHAHVAKEHRVQITCNIDRLSCATCRARRGVTYQLILVSMVASANILNLIDIMM